VVEGARLESVYTGNRIAGSNPALSAKENTSRASAIRGVFRYDAIMKLRIKDVAAAAGVSAATASKVLTGQGAQYQVNSLTIARVERVARELGYVPNAAARQLRTQRTGQIGVVLDEVTAATGAFDLKFSAMQLSAQMAVSRTFDAAIMAGLSGAARRLNLAAFVVYPQDAGQLEAAHFMDGRIDGLLVSCNPLRGHDLIRRIDAKRLPLVALWTQNVPDGVGFADADQRGGGHMATAHLLELGHRCIAFYGSGIGGGVEHFELRHQGYLDALNAAGVQPLHAKDGLEVLRLLRRDDPITAIFAETDMEAAALTRDLNAANIRIPDDVSLVGFDNVFGADFIAGGLTTVYHPAEEMAELGLKHLLDLIAGSSAEALRSVVPTQMLIRATTRAFQK
jgi:DNA-binding LacI/PurR family transcriptional regulator